MESWPLKGLHAKDLFENAMSLGIKCARRIDSEWGQIQVSNIVWVNENVTHTKIKWKPLRVKKVQSWVSPHEYPTNEDLKVGTQARNKSLGTQSWIWKTPLKSLTCY